jgi:hypothetical protein
VERTIYIAYAVRGFVFILARPPPQSRPAFTGRSTGRVLPWLVPVWTLAGRAELWLAFPFGRPLMLAPFALPVPNRLFYSRHVRDIILNNILRQVTYSLDGLYYLR